MQNIKKGIVKRLKGEKAYVDVPLFNIENGSCTSCAGCAGCSYSSKNQHLVIKNTLGARVGDSIKIGEAESFPWALCLFVFVIPLLMIFFVYFFFSNLNLTSAIALSIVAISAYLVILRMVIKKTRGSGLFEFEMIEILKDNSTAETDPNQE